jgi:lysophospholipase L1-like esterase
MNKKNRKKLSSQKQKLLISRNKKRVFVLITLVLPIIICCIMELSLRLGNYAGDLRLFIPSTAGYENYLRCNPDVARRYFFLQNTVPTPSKDLFLLKKPKDIFRIFVMGGSTTAGFPYGNNMMFSRILQKQLESIYPTKKFEIINVATAAINSYTLLDFIDEVLEQKPDLILIYAGHNEYYGALGVGSVESLGKIPWMIRSYLYLQKFKLFIFFRDVIGSIKIWISEDSHNDPQTNPSATLMARIVSEQTIPLNSDLYEAGRRQFKSNLNEILKKAKDKNVPVIISELVCNVRDQLPFISIETKNQPSANAKFKEARLLENANKFNEAKIAYYQAKDLDALRFRAPEEFNSIIYKLAGKYDFKVVPMKSYFEKFSLNGIIVNNLILEHLHPNMHGYYLMATTFLNNIIENNIIDNSVKTGIEPDYQSFIDSWGFTELDKDFADLTIKNLKSGWPFKQQKMPNSMLQNFKPKTISEKIALKILSDPNFGIEMGHLKLAKYYEKHKNY